MTSIFKVKRLRTIFIIYWVLLVYIIAVFVWWFIALNNQNRAMTEYRLQQLDKTSAIYQKQVAKIEKDNRSMRFGYAGEGITFLLLIVAGAVFVFRALRNQFRISQQQQNFMMAITHELKTPIAIAKLNLETLQRHKLEPEQQSRLIQTTVQEANRLNDLCNNMLLASQIEAGGYKITEEPINFSSLVNNSVNDYITRFPKRQITKEIHQDIYITGDQLLLQMVINNLLDNAIKYSAKEEGIIIALKKETGKVILDVIDHGKGIEDIEKPKVFKKYYRIGNEYTKGAKGTGLGLYLTSRIVKQHRGDITVTNNVPHGCIFKVVLPGNNAN